VVLVVTGVCAEGYQAAGFDVLAVAYLFAVYAAVRAEHRAVTVAASGIMLAVLPLAALASGLHDMGEAFAQARGALELAWPVAAGAATGTPGAVCSARPGDADEIVQVERPQRALIARRLPPSVVAVTRP
jgi:EamA domain-containing membrane protein RarD